MDARRADAYLVGSIFNANFTNEVINQEKYILSTRA
jgi:hypothetical protein